MRLCKREDRQSHQLVRAASFRASTAFHFASSHISFFVFEQKETLASLPFLIRELSGRRFQKMMVVADCLGSFMH